MPSLAAPDEHPPESEPKAVLSPDTKATRALYEAVRRNNLAAVRKAFKQGASANATVMYMRLGKSADVPQARPSPVYRMASNDSLTGAKIILLFLKNGLSVRLKDENGCDVLFWAVRTENVDLVKAVLDAGASVKEYYRPLPGHGGNIVTAVGGLVRRTDEERTMPLLKLILERGADPNEYDSAGMTPLHGASFMGMVRTVEMLLNYGADPNLRTRIDRGDYVGKGLTPLDLAHQQGHSHVAALLESAAGAK